MQSRRKIGAIGVGFVAAGVTLCVAGSAIDPLIAHATYGVGGCPRSGARIDGLLSFCPFGYRVPGDDPSDANGFYPAGVNNAVLFDMVVENTSSQDVSDTFVLTVHKVVSFSEPPTGGGAVVRFDVSNGTEPPSQFTPITESNWQFQHMHSTQTQVFSTNVTITVGAGKSVMVTTNAIVLSSAGWYQIDLRDSDGAVPTTPTTMVGTLLDAALVRVFPASGPAPTPTPTPPTTPTPTPPTGVPPSTGSGGGSGTSPSIPTTGAATSAAQTAGGLLIAIGLLLLAVAVVGPERLRPASQEEPG